MDNSFKYRLGYGYILDEDYSIYINVKPQFPIDTKYIKLSTDGLLTLKEGYSWDGATDAVDTNSIIRASLVHDALYQLMEDGILSKTSFKALADEELYRIAREDGMGVFRAWYVHLAVKLFGRPEPKNV